jgi:hypothetical protein
MGLRERLEKKISADPNYGLIKMLHAGSVSKGTALSDVNDLDVAVYVEASKAPTTSDALLVPWLAERLYEANTNMNRDQFIEEQHCVRVNFKGSGLNVDMVPVLYEGDTDDRGYLVRKYSGDRVLTSIPLHLKFIRERKAKYGPEFAELIRITKWWKRIITRGDEDFKFKSFMIELLWANLADCGVELSDYPTALELFFREIVKFELENQVAFTDFYSENEIPPRSRAIVEILDPVNLANNIASRYTAIDRDRIVKSGHEALNALNEARFAPTKGRAVDCWQAILGPTFNG